MPEKTCIELLGRFTEKKTRGGCFPVGFCHVAFYLNRLKRRTNWDEMKEVTEVGSCFGGPAIRYRIWWMIFWRKKQVTPGTRTNGFSGSRIPGNDAGMHLKVCQQE